jgi:hypothetical protein
MVGTPRKILAEGVPRYAASVRRRYDTGRWVALGQRPELVRFPEKGTGEGRVAEAINDQG